MAENGSHWPMHVHNGLRCLASEIVAKEGHMNRLNVNAVKANAAQRQNAYYNQRISTKLEDSEFLLSTVMAPIPSHGDEGKNIRRSDILNIINHTIHSSPSDDVHWQLPKGIADIYEYADHLIHQGLIQEQKEKFYECPIPSLKKHILENHSPPDDTVPRPGS